MTWMEIELRTRHGSLWAVGRGPHGQRTGELEILTDARRRLTAFRIHVGNAIARAQPLVGETVEHARALHGALFQGELRDLYTQLINRTRADNTPLLLRLVTDEAELQTVPWEALCRPQSNLGFLAAAADVVVARGVYSPEPWQPRQLRRGLRILPVLTLPDHSLLVHLQQALREHVDVGAIEILPPITDGAARNPYLFERLRAAVNPHVLHLLGHGGFDRQRNPVFQLAEEPGEPQQVLPVEVLVEELRASFRTLRLIYLQACAGGRPGVFASAGQLLARAGVDAVVAHLWPVRAEVARATAKEFYGHLIGAHNGQGDVGTSLQAARRSLLADGSDAFSPLLFVRGRGTRVFDLRDRRIRPSRSTPPRREDGLADAIQTLLKQPFTLLLGDTGHDSTADLHDQLRQSLQTTLETPDAKDNQTPLHALAQRYALSAGRSRVERMLQRVLKSAHARQEPSPFLEALAPQMPPGVHCTLLWLPLLEHAIARHHPDRHVYVVLPGTEEDVRQIVLWRPPGSDDWDELESLPPIQLDRDFVILQLYGGYTPEATSTLFRPQITEDDHIERFAELRHMLPSVWRSRVLSCIRMRPIMCVGISALDWRHRTLLRWLFDRRPLPEHSVAVLTQQAEGPMWERYGAGIARSRIQTVQASLDGFTRGLRDLNNG